MVRSIADKAAQTDVRVQSVEVKIKKLDAELGRYKEQMSKLRNGPGKVRLRESMRVAEIDKNYAR